MKYQVLLSMRPYATILVTHPEVGPAVYMVGTEGLLLYEWFWMRQRAMVERFLNAQFYCFLTQNDCSPFVYLFKGSHVILANNNAPKLVVSLTLLWEHPQES